MRKAVASMVAPLLQCTKEEKSAVTRFLWSEGVKRAEIHCRMLIQYGNNCLAQRKVYELVEVLRNGRTSIVGEQHPGRPHTWKGLYLNIARQKVKQ
jgi:hypothetical protein